MAKTPSKSEKQPKTPIFTRFSPETIAAIDEICQAHPMQPSRARIIELAVNEYIERNRTQKRK